MIGIHALTYAKRFHRPGVIFSASNTDFKNIATPIYNGFSIGHPLILVSLFESNWSINNTSIKKYIKDSHTIRESKRFPHVLEYMILLSKLPKPGPVQLNILNDLLMDPVKLDDVEYLYEFIKTSN